MVKTETCIVQLFPFVSTTLFFIFCEKLDMYITTVPGYSDLFNDEIPSYSDVVKDIPSDSIILFAIVVNAELEFMEDNADLQRDFLFSMLNELPPDLTSELRISINRFKGSLIFGERYLMELLLRGLRSDYQATDISLEQQYNIIKAYFLIVDELNNQTHQLVNQAAASTSDDKEFEIIWLPMINQFEHNYYPEPISEYFKLFCFLRYAKDNLNPYLIELVKSNNFETIGQYVNSSHVLYNASRYVEKKEGALFKANNKIRIEEGVDNAHLESLTINNVDKNNISLSSLKIYPLYRDLDGNYRVINKSYLLKRTYKGPFFDLYDKTSLKDDKVLFKNKDNYISKIAKEVLEVRCFRGIADIITKSDFDCIKFDDDNDRFPDLYYRKGDNKVLLVEFKGYLFPERIPQNPDVNYLMEYISRRFIKEKDTKKGVLQLCENIRDLVSMRYKFDYKINSVMLKKNVNIYPVICHNDFNFALPGLSSYLNRVMRENIGNDIPDKVKVHDLVLMSLDNFINMFLYDKRMDDLFNVINSFERHVETMSLKHKKQPRVNEFLQSKIGFDEYIMKKGLFRRSIKNPSEKTMQISGASQITQDILDELL